jgi:hypothetical protein
MRMNSRSGARGPAAVAMLSLASAPKLGDVVAVDFLMASAK